MRADDIVLSILISAIVSFILIGVIDTTGRAISFYVIAVGLTMAAIAVSVRGDH